MKIGNAPLPISERVVAQGTAGARAPQPEGGVSASGRAFQVQLSEAAGKVVGPGIATAAEALQVATETRDMVAASNREAATVQQGLDPRKLLDLLA